MTEEEFIKEYLKYQAVAIGIIKKEVFKKIYKKQWKESPNYEKINDLDADMYLEEDYLITKKLKEKKSILKKLKLQREEEEEIVLSFEELRKYYEIWNIRLKGLEELIGQSIEEDIINLICISDMEIEDIFSILKENYSIKKSQEKNIKEELSMANYCLKRWFKNGKSNHEELFPKLKEVSLLQKTPKENKLSAFLKNSSLEHKRDLKDYYMETNENKLSNEIVKEFEQDLKMLPIETIKFLLNLNEKEMEYSLQYDLNYLMVKGYLYNILNKKRILAVFPEEILNLLKAKNQEENKETLEDIILIYLVMNGIVLKKKLKEIVEEALQMPVEEDEIEDTIKKIGIFKKKNYYTFIKDFDEYDEIMLDFLKRKKEFPEEKNIKDFTEKVEEKQDKEICDYLERIGKKELQEIVLKILNASLQVVDYKEKRLLKMMRDYKLPLTKEEQSKIIEIVRKYYKDIPLWQYNGWTLREVEEKYGDKYFEKEEKKIVEKKDKKVLKFYDLTRIVSRINKEYGSIEGYEEYYNPQLDLLEHYIYEIWEEIPLKDTEIILVLQMILFDLKGAIENKEYDYKEFLTKEIKKYKVKLECYMNPFKNNELKKVLKGVNLEDKEDLKDLFDYPLKFLARIIESIELWRKERGANGYLNMLEEMVISYHHGVSKHPYILEDCFINLEKED